MAFDDKGLQMLITTWVFTGLASLVVLLKLFTRAKLLTGLGWDDFFIFLSIVSPQCRRLCTVGSKILHAWISTYLLTIRFCLSCAPRFSPTMSILVWASMPLTYLKSF